ncbi:hypothetical protein SAMN05216327_109153 [Dyadobacter sp. SG02]|uniref:hypothetical protein n=1 Tax=Dyadobacter sp. SG02 TaxID=1855291 RepID=UPI0008B3BF42|nr:hypothetical protein [Dyadobacter sp. SG02]SEJ38292.1 hypothetical protein SAMN05216327_109153 [Dyadobacter sp. SG02]
MKNTKLAIAILLILWLAGCVRLEAENMEADILGIKLPDSALIAPPVVSASGNSGFSLVTPEKKPEAYPTRPSTADIKGTYSALFSPN